MDEVSVGSIGLEVLKFGLPILSSVLIVVLTALAKKFLDKMGIENNQKLDATIDKYVEIGVRYANQAASKKLDNRTLDSKDKLALATRTVLLELEQSGIKDVAEALIRARVESLLNVKAEAEKDAPKV